MPGLRLGRLVLPSHLVEEIASDQALHGQPCSALDQLTVTELISSGRYDRHVRRSRLAYRRRRDRLVAATARGAPRSRVTGISAGLHVVVELPLAGPRATSWPGRPVTASACRDSTRSAPMTKPPRPAALVVGYGAPPEHAYSSAVARLAAVLADHD